MEPVDPSIWNLFADGSSRDARSRAGFALGDLGSRQQKTWPNMKPFWSAFDWSKRCRLKGYSLAETPSWLLAKLMVVFQPRIRAWPLI